MNSSKGFPGCSHGRVSASPAEKQRLAEAVKYFSVVCSTQEALREVVGEEYQRAE